jgi:hypothetical protein
MASHFSTIGFPLETPDDFPALAKRVADSSEVLPCPGGSYLHWVGASGAELWVQLDEGGRFLDIQPHFSAMATMRVGLTKRLLRPTDTPLDGAWQGWADPLDDEDPSLGRFELTFEAPDFGLNSELQLPIVVSVQLAAFAHQVTLFDTEEEFRESPLVAGRLDVQSFIPSPQRVRERGETEPQRAEALVCGHILKVQQLTNDLTGLPFYWLLLETDGGRIDLLIDPELLPHEPPAGGIIMTVCWLSGRIL